MSRVLKKYSVMMDDTKKFTIPVSGMPKEKEEEEVEDEEFRAGLFIETGMGAAQTEDAAKGGVEPEVKSEGEGEGQGEVSEEKRMSAEPQPMLWEVLPASALNLNPNTNTSTNVDADTNLSHDSTPGFDPGLVPNPNPEVAEQVSVEEQVPESEIVEEKEPEIVRREYNFEDFNFAAQDALEEQFAEEEKRRMEREREAEELLENARNKSEMIISQAAETAHLIIVHTLDNAKTELNNAVSAGYTSGFEAGRSEALRVVEPALHKIGLLTETINRLQDKMLYEFRDSIFNIISEISKKIVHKEVNEDNHYLVALFSDAIQGIKAEEFVTITVAESELAVATRNEKLFLSEISHIKDFKILSDKNAAKGTMIVETEKAVVDASIDLQLKKVDYFLEQMKENLDIPKTVDDVLNQVSMKNIEDQAEKFSNDNGDAHNGGNGDGTGVKYNGEINTDFGDYNSADNFADINGNIRTNDRLNDNGKINQRAESENTQNFDDINIDDISDEEIMKYFNSPDFNVD